MYKNSLYKATMLKEVTYFNPNDRIILGEDFSFIIIDGDLFDSIHFDSVDSTTEIVNTIDYAYIKYITKSICKSLINDIKLN